MDKKEAFPIEFENALKIHGGEGESTSHSTINQLYAS